MASVGSVSTRGGVPFDILCEGEISNYSFDLVNLVEGEDSEKKGKMDRDVKKLSKKIKDTIKSLEIGPIDREGSAIKHYYIGKTYIHRKKKRGSGFQKFNHMKDHTWKKKGISSRYKSHSTKNYGRDGLVVLAAITRDALPRDHLPRITQEDYALILEQRLTQHLLINERDPRVCNATFSEGRRQRKPQGVDRNTDNSSGDSDEKGAYAYAIYMAFKREKSYDENDESTDDEDKLTSPPVKKKPKLQRESKPKKDKLIKDLSFRKEYFIFQKKKKEKKVRFKLPKHRYRHSVCPLRKPSSVLSSSILPKPRYHPTICPLQEKKVRFKLPKHRYRDSVCPLQKPSSVLSSLILPKPRYHPTIRPLEKAIPFLLPPILPNDRHHPTIRPLQKAMPFLLPSILPNHRHHPTINPLQKPLPNSRLVLAK